MHISLPAACRRQNELADAKHLLLCVTMPYFQVTLYSRGFDLETYSTIARTLCLPPRAIGNLKFE